MQYAKCIKSNVQGSLAEKLFAQLISRHSPDFVLFFSFLYTDLFNVIVTLYFLQTEMLPAAQKKIYESLKEARRRRHFWVFGSSPKKYWFHQSESHLRIDTDLCFFYMCLLFYLWHVYCFVLIFYREEDNSNTAARSTSHIVLHAGQSVTLTLFIHVLVYPMSIRSWSPIFKAKN